MAIQNGNTELLGSYARTSTTASRDIINNNCRGCQIILDVTSVTATPSITVTIQGKDPVSGKYYTILTSSPVTATGTVVYRVYPGITAVANLSASDVIPSLWRVSVAHGDSDSITYSVSANMVV